VFINVEPIGICTLEDELSEDELSEFVYIETIGKEVGIDVFEELAVHILLLA